MEKKNKLRAGRICVGATINSLAATSAFVVIALMLYELTGKLNVPYSTLSVAYTFAYAGMMLASFFGGKIITRNGRLGPVISTSAALFGLLSLTYTPVSPPLPFPHSGRWAMKKKPSSSPLQTRQDSSAIPEPNSNPSK